MSGVSCTIRAFCPDCDGEGHFTVPVSCYHSTIQSALSCKRCGGSDVEDEVCETCRGLGEVERYLDEEDLDELVIEAIHLHHIERGAGKPAAA